MRSGIVAVAFVGWTASVQAAFPPPGAQRASAAAVEPDGGDNRRSGGLLLAVAAPELTGSARRDFELNLTRGLRFSGLDVVAESSGGAAAALATCADPACVRAIGAARSVVALARASVRSTSDDERDDSRRSYTIEIEVFATSTGRSTIQRRKVCTDCKTDVAAHLAYLLAAEVGQRLGQILADGPPASAAAPVTGPSAPMAHPAVEARPISVARTPSPTGRDTAPVAPAGPPAAIAVDASSDGRPTGGSHHLAAGVLGGLGVAALTAGAVLWLRGPQSTCPGLPASACGQTYDDTTTGQVLVGAGAAALAGAIIWWSWPSAATERHAKSAPAARVAITWTGVLVGGRF